MSEKEKMLAGQLYDPSDAELSALRLNARLLCERFNLSSANKQEERIELLNQLLGRCGQNLYVEQTFNCDYGFNIELGEHFYANFGCVILDVAKVTFGNHCKLGPQVGIYTATHPTEPLSRLSGLEFAKPISIGNNCWIGGHAVINPGVTLGDNVVVASGSVVTKSFSNNFVIAGNPAKVIKAITQD
ncbi:sugar O-acetyltransferase [Agaribacterium sp. ZY112]|uniref:sugar O-acetyltransferase n=1 Tax=Agaribacterium sp. ZY112 TaxID=3233574 RepID=UPI003523A96A